MRHKPVHHNQYARLYAMIEETGKPLVFHAGPHWDDPSFTQLNRFISMHALSFVHYNLIHMTNWIVNAHARAFSEDEDDLGGKRPRLDAVPDAAARP